MSPATSSLAERIASISLLRGTFTLRSGRTSSYYLDKYLFSTRPDILRELGEMFARRLPEGTTRLAGAELGGIPLVTAASLASGLPCLFVRNQKKDYGTARSEEHTSELQSRENLVCRLLLRRAPTPPPFPYTTLFRSTSSRPGRTSSASSGRCLPDGCPRARHAWPALSSAAFRS